MLVWFDQDITTDQWISQLKHILLAMIRPYTDANPSTTTHSYVCSYHADLENTECHFNSFQTVKIIKNHLPLFSLKFFKNYSNFAFEHLCFNVCVTEPYTIQ